MQLNITARHIGLTPALSDYIHNKVEKSERYFGSIVWAQAILSVEKHRHIAEVVVHTPGNTFRTKGVAGDLYSAVDLAAHKLDLHLSRFKDKRRNHRGRTNSERVAETVLEPSGQNLLPAIIKERKSIVLEPKSLSEAIRELASNGMPFVLYLNERTNAVTVLYKKGKEAFGILEGEE